MDMITGYHFCCSHSAALIGRRGLIRPMIRHPLLGCLVAWFTTDAEPQRMDVGLTSLTIKCDRMEYRYVARSPKLIPWLGSPARAAAPRDAVSDLEAFGRPETWLICESPVVGELFPQESRCLIR